MGKIRRRTKHARKHAKRKHSRRRESRVAGKRKHSRKRVSRVAGRKSRRRGSWRKFKGGALSADDLQRLLNEKARIKKLQDACLEEAEEMQAEANGKVTDAVKEQILMCRDLDWDILKLYQS